MKITRRQLRRVIWEAMEQVPRWPESHPAWRDVAFTRDDEIRYILDVADPETVQAAADIGEPFPPGTNVLIIKGATPDSEKVFLHDSELLDLINREGWRIPEPPPGAGPGMWGGHGKWIEDLPEAELPPAMEEPIGEGKKMRITRRQLRHIIEASKSTIKYNADDALKGDQTKLPDKLQKGIIDAEEDDDKVAEIKEIAASVAHPRDNLGKNIADVDFPIVVGYSGRSEIAYDQDELDDILDMITGGPGSKTNIPYSLDSLDDMEPADRPVGSEIERYAESKRKMNEAMPAGGVPDIVGAVTGVYGEEQRQLLNDLGDMYSDMHKELHGRRPNIPMFKNVEEAQDAVDEIWQEYAESNRRDEELAQNNQARVEMEQRMQDLMPDDYDIELPMQSGMGRRSESNNRGFNMKITKRQLRRIIKEEKAKLIAEYSPGVGSPTGDDISDEVYRQALQLFGPSAIIDEENGELYIDTGLVDDDVEALYNDWIALWPDAMHEEGGLVYTGVSLDENY
jgi:hypothetical protein